MKDISVCHVCHHRIQRDVRTYLVNTEQGIVPICEGCLTKQHLDELSHNGLWFRSKVSIGKNYLNGSSVYNVIIYPESQIKQGYQLKAIVAHFLLSTGVFEKMTDCIIAYHDDGDTADWYALEIQRPQGVEPYVMTDHMTMLGISNRLNPKYMIPGLLNLGILNFQHDPGRIGNFIERHNQPYRLSELPVPCPILCWKDLMSYVSTSNYTPPCYCNKSEPMHCYQSLSLPKDLYVSELTDDLQRACGVLSGNTRDVVMTQVNNHMSQLFCGAHMRHQIGILCVDDDMTITQIEWIPGSLKSPLYTKLKEFRTKPYIGRKLVFHKER